MPGLQAVNERGGVLRQLNLANDRLTLTRFPSFSSECEIIFASRYER